MLRPAGTRELLEVRDFADGRSAAAGPNADRSWAVRRPAIVASDLTLVRGDLRAARDASRTLRTIKANLFWAFAYNVAALPLAALGMLNPMITGAAMASSSVFVVSNSLRLRRFQPLHR